MFLRDEQLASVLIRALVVRSLHGVCQTRNVILAVLEGEFVLVAFEMAVTAVERREIGSGQRDKRSNSKSELNFIRDDDEALRPVLEVSKHP